MKYSIMVLAASLGFLANAAAAQQTEYNCEAPYNEDEFSKNVQHMLTVGTDGGAITRFEFLSFTPPGATLCAYIADSGAKAADGKAKAGDSLPVWSRTASGAEVTLPAKRGGDSAVIRLEDKGSYFLFEIVEIGSTQDFCSIFGIAAPKVKLRKNSKTCGFPK